ncbi:hypothetical protein NLI96_g3845 [Meripilus lineatus]|uniref:Fungal-type protein kinase domain-containing protein n=1 Tax=Meripilus lineatus TaxID=2056292 RepID=A0AAD5VBE8_9APHY|nr:hypothetical protein NLI96_g3845 [Physisporinus lineatus]
MGKSTSERSELNLLDSGRYRSSVSRTPTHSLIIDDVQPQVRSRKEAENLDNATGSSASDFVSQHLKQSPSNIFDFTEEQGLVNEITSTEAGSADLSTALAKLLTKYSNLAHAYQPAERRPRYPYLFLGYRHNVPGDAAFNYEDHEDIIATSRPMSTFHRFLGDTTDFRSVTLYDAISLIECKPLRVFGREQIASYAYELFEVRPEISGAYTLWARPQHYEIMWVDASGIVVSPQFTWSDLTPLRHYVWSLYNPPDTHFPLDTTMKRHIGNPSLWSFHLETNDYCNMKRTFIGSPYGRRTNVYVSSAELHQDSVVVVKDSYPSDEYHDFELEGIKYIHEHGVFPGVVRILPSGGSGPVFPVIKTLSAVRTSVNTNRVKHRLVLGSTGQDLLQASSVLEMLMAIFDILEGECASFVSLVYAHHSRLTLVHRALFKRRNILHRDMSIYNILIRPQHNPKTMEGKTLIDDPPVFIKAILNGLTPASNEQVGVTDESESAILIDFDNYAEFKVEDQVNGSLKDRTGTPMFIARSACAQEVRGVPWFQLKLHEPMPLLEGEAEQLYMQTYGEKAYNDFCDKQGVTFHGVKLPKTFPDDPKYHHLPEHDVESVFWVLYYALIQANPSPQVDVPKKDNNIFYDTMDLFFLHKVHDGADSREPILTKSKKALERTLHPGLASLSDMLIKMIAQILPEYGHLPDLKTKRPEHLHEAMRRILLTQIVKMLKDKDPIPLQAGHPRKYPPDGEKQTETKNEDKTSEATNSGVVSRMKRRAQSTNEVRPKRPCVASEKLNLNEMPQYLSKQRLP